MSVDDEGSLDRDEEPEVEEPEYDDEEERSDEEVDEDFDTSHITSTRRPRSPVPHVGGPARLGRLESVCADMLKAHKETAKKLAALEAIVTTLVSGMGKTPLTPVSIASASRPEGELSDALKQAITVALGTRKSPLRVSSTCVRVVLRLISDFRSECRMLSTK